jgi:hypothetical protein
MGQDSQGKAAVFGGILGRIEADHAAAAAALDGLSSQSREMPSVLRQGTLAAEGCILPVADTLRSCMTYHACRQPWLRFESTLQAQRVNFFQTISRFVAGSSRLYLDRQRENCACRA